MYVLIGLLCDYLFLIIFYSLCFIFLGIKMMIVRLEWFSIGRILFLIG